jgi:hypothetical protein
MEEAQNEREHADNRQKGGSVKVIFLILILAGCVSEPIKLDCEWEPIELRPGEMKVAIDYECLKKIREMQIRCAQ